MKNLIRTSSFVIFLCVGQIIMSCSTNKLLTADFESDTVGNLPDQSLPGDPVGDSMTCYQSANTAYSGAYRVIERVGGTSGRTEKWLQIVGNVGSTYEPRIVHFIPKTASLDNPVFTVSWKGAIQHPTANSAFDMAFYSGAFTGGQLFFSLTFKRETYRGEQVSSIYLRENGSDQDDGELIGRVRPDAPHSINVFINTEAGRFTILGSGLPVTIERAIPSRITNVREPRISMSYSESGGGAYQLENIQIIEGVRRRD